MLEVEGDLSACVTEHDTLKIAPEKDAAEVRRLEMERQEVASRANVPEEELCEATEVASGKPYLLQCVFGHQAFPELTQVWLNSSVFYDLPHSVEESC